MGDGMLGCDGGAVHAPPARPPPPRTEVRGYKMLDVIVEGGPVRAWLRGVQRG